MFSRGYMKKFTYGGGGIDYSKEGSHFTEKYRECSTGVGWISYGGGGGEYKITNSLTSSDIPLQVYSKVQKCV